MSPGLAGGQLPLGISLPLETRLEDFVPGPNGDALAACSALADGDLAGCLFLAGPPATGKTHLLQGLCRQAHANGQASAYLPLDREALRAPELLDGWADFDLVCIDGLEPVAGDGDWERALFSVFEGLREHGGRLAVTAGNLPRGLGLSLPDLASRLASGPVYQLSLPDDDTLAEVLRQRLARKGLSLPAESGRWLLRRTRRDLHSLMALADQLDESSLSAKRRLTVPFLRQVLGDPESG